MLKPGLPVLLSGVEFDNTIYEGFSLIRKSGIPEYELRFVYDRSIRIDPIAVLRLR